LTLPTCRVPRSASPAPAASASSNRDSVASQGEQDVLAGLRLDIRLGRRDDLLDGERIDLADSRAGRLRVDGQRARVEHRWNGTVVERFDGETDLSTAGRIGVPSRETAHSCSPRGWRPGRVGFPASLNQWRQGRGAKQAWRAFSFPPTVAQSSVSTCNIPIRRGYNIAATVGRITVQ
jgi:hypothetical protein